MTEREKFGLGGGGVTVMEAVADLVESATLVTLTVALVLTLTWGRCKAPKWRPCRCWPTK